MFFLFTLMFVCCDAFLIDTTNPPSTGQYMTDKHYKLLMDFFIEERQARVHLEDFVTQLQKELVKTQTAFGNKLHELNKENNTLEQYVKELKNKTEVLDNRLFDVESENIRLKTELNDLRKSHGALDNKLHYFDTEIQSLKQLKNIANLQAVFKISNKTDHLEHELQNTNSQIVVLQTSDNARKQDFLALYNKTMVVDQSMNSKFQSSEAKNKARIQTMEQTMNSQFQSSETTNKARIQKVAVDVSQNSIKVTKALDDITAYNQRTAVSLFPVSKSYSPGSTIMFTGVRTSNGLNSTSLADIVNKGYFTCDNDGLYRISVSLMTYTVPSRVDMYKNGGLLNFIYLRGSTGSGAKHTTFDSLERLSKGDDITLKAGTTLFVYGGKHYSVLSVFQITK